MACSSMRDADGFKKEGRPMSRKEALSTLVAEARKSQWAAIQWKMQYFVSGASVYAELASEKFKQAKDALRRARLLKQWTETL